ncbi:unnamed protein product [Cylicocyclus nassatus]|uniref:C-type lectin domain-containing protein n=1 Tax=Cylicocyclus nassatus TaxID=53992 RepID=A0AA36HCI5_CYLNA|nr:unnamed protein product [Cylicocyclus nassatus]
MHRNSTICVVQLIFLLVHSTISWSNHSSDDDQVQGELLSWRVRYVRKDNSEMEHLLVNFNVSRLDAEEVCRSMEMELGSFEDLDEQLIVIGAFQNKCTTCGRYYWIDTWWCNFASSLQQEQNYCGNLNVNIKKGTFICTKMIAKAAKGIEVIAQGPDGAPMSCLFIAKPTTFEDAKKQCNDRGYRLGEVSSIAAAHPVEMFRTKCPTCGGLYWVDRDPDEKIAEEESVESPCPAVSIEEDQIINLPCSEEPDIHIYKNQDDDLRGCICTKSLLTA